MARKKKTNEPIKGLGKSQEKLLVQKSRPLFSLWRSDFSLAEFKILDTYLARINSDKPVDNSVVFEKGELESLLGVKRITRTDLDTRLKSLGSPVDLEKNNPNKIHRVTLFEESYAEKDEFGIWKVKLTCTQKAMQYFFKIEKLGYLRYQLRSITSLTSRYTYLLFIYLEDNRFRKTWEEDLEYLKEILGCANDDLYSEYKFFNQRILKRCHKELTEKTECHFTYEPVKKGRKVVAIRFTLETLSDSIVPKSELQSADKEESYEQLAIDVSHQYVYTDSTLSFMAEACNFTFDESAMRVIYDALIEAVPSEGEPLSVIDIKRFDYLEKCYHRLLERESRIDKDPVENRRTYLESILRRKKI